MTIPSASAISRQCLWISGGSEASRANFRARQEGVEPFLVEIVEKNVVTVALQRLDGFRSDGVVEAAGSRVSQDNGYLHDLFPSMPRLCG